MQSIKNNSKPIVKRSICPKCQNKGWYFVNEWIGNLQGRKDCSCKGNVVGSGGLSFDEFKAFIHSIEAPAQRLGIFRLQIKNRGKLYDFDRLKETATFNEDNCGFSLNHYGWMNFPKQNCKRSKFHDEEDVSIDIDRSEFVKANKVPDNNEIILEMKNWDAIVSW
jgi:hypothetical protein